MKNIKITLEIDDKSIFSLMTDIQYKNIKEKTGLDPLIYCMNAMWKQLTDESEYKLEKI